MTNRFDFATSAPLTWRKSYSSFTCLLTYSSRRPSTLIRANAIVSRPPDCSCASV